MEEITVVLAGVGTIGKEHVETLRAHQGTRLAAVVRTSTSATPELDLPVYRSLQRALDEHRPTLAIVATPHAQHYQQVHACLSCGCHVLTEKPLALTYGEADQLVQLAKERNLHLVVGLQRRYEGLASAFRELQARDRLGQILLVHGLFAHRFATELQTGWRQDAALAGAGILHDSALHLLDLLLYFAGGRANGVSAIVDWCGDSSVPHSFEAVFKTDTGASVVGCASYLSPSNSVQEEISIFGERGALFGRRFRKEWNTNPPEVVYKSSDGQYLQEFDLGGVPSGRSLPLLALLDVLLGKSRPESLLTEAWRTLETHRVVELIDASGRAT